MGLLKTQSQIARLEANILDQFGEISDEQSDQLTELNNQIENDRDNAFRFLHSKRPKEIKEQIKGRIDGMKKEIERLEKIEGAIENSLHRFLEDKDYYEVKDENGDSEFFVKNDLSVRRSVNGALIPEDSVSQKFEITLSNDSATSFKSLLEADGYEDYKVFPIYPNVTDLPEDHPAIIKNITPKVKFLKRKPK